MKITGTSLTPDAGAVFEHRVSSGNRHARILILILLALIVDLSDLPAAPVEPAREAEEIRRIVVEGRYGEADERARALLARVESTHGVDSLEVADVLNLLIRVHSAGSTGTIPEMLEFAKRAVRIQESRLAPDDARIADGLYSHGMILFELGELDAARPLLERSIEIREEALGPDHPKVADSLDGLGIVRVTEKKLDAARGPIERSLHIRRQQFGPDHPQVAQSLMSLGCLQSYENDLEAARASFELAHAIRIRQLGPDHQKVAGSAHNVAYVLHRLGELESARAFYEEALEIRAAVPDPDLPRLARTLAAAGGLAYALGDFGGAVAHYRRATEIQETYLGPDHREYASILTKLALALYRLGSQREGERLLGDALEIRERVLPVTHPDIASSLFLIGWTRLQQDEAAARSYFRRALKIYEASSGADPEGLAHVQFALAMSLPPEEEVEARRLTARAFETFEQVYGPGLELARLLTNRAEQLYSAGELSGATETFARALRITEEGEGKDHPDIPRILQGQARALAAQGRTDQAQRVALRAAVVARGYLDTTARWFAEREALGYATTQNESLDAVFSVMALVGNPRPDVIRESWDALLRVRGAVLDEMSTRHRFLHSTTDPKLLDLARSLQQTRQRLADRLVRGPDVASPERYGVVLAELRRKEEKQQRALAEQSLDFRRERSRRHLGLDDVVSRLREGWGLVSYGKYNRYDPSRPSQPSVESYVAFVWKPDGSGTAWVDLGLSSEIDGLVAEWKREAGEGYLRRHDAPTEAEAAYRTAGGALRERVWDPLAPMLLDASRIFVVPDGDLNVVNFASLPVGDRRFLVEGPAALHLLTAETDLVVPDRDASRAAGLLALGWADFTASSLFAALRQEGEGPVSVAAALASPGLRPYRGQRAACADFRSMTFESLPASRREVEQIAAMWSNSRERTGSDATEPQASGRPLTLTGAAANETALKQLAAGRRILHIATHGFFLGGGCARVSEDVRGIGGLVSTDVDPQSSVDVDNPLLLSGLALAGANHRRAAGPEEDDGILTSDEIAMMNLADVEWVVLSACDTGVGRIQIGEGVFGLRRAFRIAGARTLIMSLWSVEDETAREWMHALYDGRLNRELDTAQAVRHATLTVLSRRRADGLSTHPFFWAGFVAAGDWR